MLFNFNINEVLKSDLSILDNKSKLGYVPIGTNINSLKLMDTNQKLSFIIDQMGKASALAQDLPTAITSSSKLRHSDHRLYLLKVDDEDNGEVVGLLKVGYKTLFVYDNQSRQNELRPLCVLDFYVHESKQRQGYGRQLFDCMLRTENVQPHHIAVDRPSSKFLMFLAKHYDLTDKIPQLNNFVVFINFFNNRPDMNGGGHRRSRAHHPQTPTSVASVPITTIASVTKSPPPVAIPSPQSSPPKHIASVTNAHTNLTIQQPRRRTQSSATKDRSQVNIDELPLSKNHLDSEHDMSGPPLLGRDGVPRSYRSLMSGAVQSRLSSAEQCRHVLPMIVSGSRSPDKCGLPQGRTQQYGRSRRDYNYDVGLARHYSHTRLW